MLHLRIVLYHEAMLRHNSPKSRRLIIKSLPIGRKVVPFWDYLVEL